MKRALCIPFLMEICGWRKRKTEGIRKTTEEGAAVATFWKPFPPLLPGCLHEQESLGKGAVTWRKQSQEPWRRAFGRDRELMQTSVAFSTPEAIFPPTAVGVPPWAYNAWEIRCVFMFLPVCYLVQPSECSPYCFQLSLPAQVSYQLWEREKWEKGTWFQIWCCLLCAICEEYCFTELLFSYTFCFSLFLVWPSGWTRSRSSATANPQSSLCVAKLPKHLCVSPGP